MKTNSNIKEKISNVEKEIKGIKRYGKVLKDKLAGKLKINKG